MCRRNVLRFAVLLVVASFPLKGSADPMALERLRAVLWVGGFAHDFDAIAQILAEDLAKLVPMEIQVARDGSFLDSPEAEQLDLILINHCHKSTQGVLSDTQKRKFLELVRGGTGVVAIHASYYSFLDWDEYHELYGARFVKHGSSDVELLVTIVDKDHAITMRMPLSFKVRSELYQSTPLTDDCQVLARAKEEGAAADYPSVWTRTYGRGRVVTILPAHWPEAYRAGEFQNLIASSALWVAHRLDGPDRNEEDP